MIRFSANLFRIAFLCVSKEETRYYLNGVYVEPHPQGGVTLTATDGHRIFTVRDDSGFADETAIVRFDTKACKAKRGMARIVKIETGANDATVFETSEVDIGDETTFQKIAAAFDVKITGCEYPDYRRCVPSDFTTKGEIPAFNGTYLGDFGKIGNELAAHFGTSKAAPMRVISADATSPALIQWGGINQAFGILMPMRGAFDNQEPPWFRAVSATLKAA